MKMDTDGPPVFLLG